LASTISTDNNISAQLLVFRLGERTYGMELGTVREIIPARSATRLPGAPPYIAGLVNVRGTVVTVFDLGARLGGRPIAPGRGSVVLVERAGRVVGAKVDEVLDVRRMAEVELDTGVDVLTPGNAIRALGRLDGALITLVDIHGIISQGLA
jgi:purine-binding chemotaxis protein CheW